MACRVVVTLGSCRGTRWPFRRSMQARETSAARPGTLHAVRARINHVVLSAAAGAVLIAGSLAALSACGSSGGTGAGSDASATSGCVAGQTYCSSCTGGGFCSASCPAVACPVSDSGLTDAAGSGADAVGFALTSLDESCEGGPTGRQLLMYVESTYKGTYDPPPSHPDAGPSALTITASYGGGAIECFPAPAYSCCAGCPCRAPPPPSVTVDLDVGFKNRRWNAGRVGHSDRHLLAGRLRGAVDSGVAEGDDQGVVCLLRRQHRFLYSMASFATR